MVLLRLLLKSAEIFNLPISNSSISDFKLAKSVFLANYDVSASAALFKSDFVA